MFVAGPLFLLRKDTPILREPHKSGEPALAHIMITQTLYCKIWFELLTDSPCNINTKNASVHEYNLNSKPIKHNLTRILAMPY